jgi:hypothetical protein
MKSSLDNYFNFLVNIAPFGKYFRFESELCFDEATLKF